MHTRLRMDSASWGLCTAMAWNREAPVRAAVARPVDLVGEDCREYLLVPTMMRGEDEPPGTIPVYFHCSRDAQSRMLQLGLFETEDRQEPYILVASRPRRRPRAAFVASGGAATQIEHIVLVGSSVYRPRLPGRRRGQVPLHELESGPWSRTIGGMGGDLPALNRLQTAHYALVGCGRNGALLASHLASIGVRGKVRLIDDDRIEPHNVAAMGLDTGWVAAPKVEAVARMFRRTNLDAEVQTLEAPATSPEAVRAMAAADFILSAVDHGEGRLVVASVGAAYLRPVLDVGSSIGFDELGRWEAGVDVRLTVPGRCLLCFGGIRDLTSSREIQWWEQRAGSLRSINSVATGLAQTLLERFFSSDGANGPLWVNLVVTADGSIRSQTHHQVESGGACPVCTQMGVGDRMFDAPAERVEDEALPF